MNKKSGFKTIALLLVFLMAISLAACGTTGNNTTTATTAPTTAQVTEKDPLAETMDVSWLVFAKVPEDAKVKVALEKKFNIKIIVKDQPWEEDAFRIYMASGDIADVNTLPDAWAKPFDMLKTGLIRSIPKSFIENYTPGYAKLFNENPVGWKLNLFPTKDDEYLCFPDYAGTAKGVTDFMQMRYDWLQNLGITPNGTVVPTGDSGRLFFTDQPFTLAQIETIFDAFLNKDPDKNGKKDTIPVGGSAWTLYGKPYGGAVGWVDGKNAKVGDEVLPAEIQPGYKEYIKLMAKWYKLGYLDNEFANLGIRQEWAKTTSGITGTWFAHYGWNTIQPTGDRPPVTLCNNVPDAKVLNLPPLVGPDGKTGVGALEIPFANWTFISKNVSDEKLARIMQVMEYANFDPDGMILSQFGVEGEDFTWTGEPKNSVAKWKPEIEIPAGLVARGIQQFGNWVYTDKWVQYSYGPSHMVLYNWGVSEAAKIYKVFNYAMDVKSTTNLGSVKAQYESTVNTLADEIFYKAVTGKIDIDAEWDAYVKKYREIGGDAIIKELGRAQVMSELLK